MKKLFIFTFILGFNFLAIFAQDDAKQESTWGIEADLLVPFVPEANIITIRLAKTIFGSNDSDLKGDFLVGVYIRPHISHDIVYTIDEYLFTIGYRQYIWDGLHLEGQIDIGQAWGTNRIDNKYYDNFALLGEGHLGYRIKFSPKETMSLYLNPQVGIIHGLSTDIGPRGGKSDTFVSAKINLGLTF